MDVRDDAAVPVMASPAELDAARAAADEVMLALVGVREFLAEQSAHAPPPENGRSSSLPFIMMEHAVRNVERDAARAWEVLSRLSFDAQAAARREPPATGRANHADP